MFWMAALVGLMIVEKNWPGTNDNQVAYFCRLHEIGDLAESIRHTREAERERQMP